MTDSTSGSFMDGHGNGVRARDFPIQQTLSDIAHLACMANELIISPQEYGAAANIVARIESLASGLVQELTLLRDKEEGK